MLVYLGSPSQTKQLVLIFDKTDLLVYLMDHGQRSVFKYYVTTAIHDQYNLMHSIEAQ